MSRWKPRLRRAAIGSAILGPLLSVAVLLWYRSAYSLPAEPPITVRLPYPNGYDTLREASKLKVSAIDGVYSTPDNKTPWPLAGRKKLLAANTPALNRIRLALRQEFLVPPMTRQIAMRDTTSPR